MLNSIQTLELSTLQANTRLLNNRLRRAERNLVEAQESANSIEALAAADGSPEAATFVLQAVLRIQEARTESKVAKFLLRDAQEAQMEFESSFGVQDEAEETEGENEEG